MDTTPGAPVLTATDSATGISGMQTETVNPGTAITFTTAPATVSAGKQSATITIRETNDNSVGVPKEVIFLTSSSGNGTFYNSATGAPLPTAGGVPFVVTDATGHASFLYVDTTVGSPTLKATDAANIALVGQQMETVTAGVANSIAFTTNDTTAKAGQLSGPNTILVKDMGGVAVAGELVNLRSTSGTGVFYNGSGPGPPSSAA